MKESRVCVCVSVCVCVGVGVCVFVCARRHVRLTASLISTDFALKAASSSFVAGGDCDSSSNLPSIVNEECSMFIYQRRKEKNKGVEIRREEHDKCNKRIRAIKERKKKKKKEEKGEE